MKKTNSGYLFLTSFFTVLIVTPLFQRGVFGDGLMYLTVAFNRFKGYGSFWQQHYSDTSMSFFCEQPPLYFESLSWFYKLFGGAEVGAKIFTLVLLVGSVILISAIWNKLNSKDNSAKKITWLPSLLLIAVPVFSWTYANQVIETMVIPLSLLGFYLHLVFIETPNKGKKIIAFLGIAILMFLLLLTKGVQSVFLLSALFLAGITYDKKEIKKLITYNLLLLGAFAGICALVFFSNEKAHFWLDSYFHKRLVATFNHVGATANYHAEIIVRYFNELVPLIILLLLISVYFKWKRKYSFSLQWKNIRNNKKALWLLLISLSASLPLALTLEQRGFYLGPSFPFVVLAVSLLYKRYFFVLTAKMAAQRKMVFVAGVTTLAGSLVFFSLTKDNYKRDETMIKDVAILKKAIPYGSVIGIDSSMWNTFSLHSYLNMENNNSLAMTDTTRFFIFEKESKKPKPVNYTRLDLRTNWLDLYVKNKAK